MIKRCGLLLGLVLCCPCMALQVKPVEDNRSTTVNISSNDVTRLVVQGDRIQKVVGVRGNYRLERDEAHGTVYLQPMPDYQHRPFTLQIETEAGFHFTALCYPSEVPGDTVLFRSYGKRLRGE